jgi:putative DNA primase/helicase
VTSKDFRPVEYVQRILKRKTLIYKPDDGLYEYSQDKGYWKPIHESYVEGIALGMLGDRAKAAKLSDTRKLVERSCIIPSDRDFNDIKGFLNVKNGMFYIQTKILGEHRKAYLSTIQLKVNYNPAAKSPRWEQFLVEVFEGDPELIALIQEFMGYSLNPDTRYEKALLMIGEGANGKSTLIKVWEQLLGAENISSVTLSNLKDQFHRVTLHRKLLNMAAESNSMTVNQSDYFKRIVSGDTIDAAHKHKPVFSFRPYARLVFAMNRMPQVKDTSHGFYRRLILVPFNRKFEGEDADRGLSNKLLAELDGIFLWALEGLARLYQNDGFTEPQSSRKRLAGYKRANNPVVAFVEDCCELEADASTKKQDLYKQFKDYCSDYGYSAGSDNEFFKELYPAYPTLRAARLGPREMRDHYVKGIKMVETVSEVASG